MAKPSVATSRIEVQSIIKNKDNPIKSGEIWIEIMLEDKKKAILSKIKDPTIHGFLFPIWENWYESTNGPIINLNIQGNEAMDVIMAISLIEKFIDAIQSNNAK